MNTGTPTPLSRYTGPAVLKAHEVTGDHRRSKSVRVDHRGALNDDGTPKYPSSELSVDEQYASMRANAAPKIAERPVRTQADFDREQLRQAASAAAGSAINSGEAKAINARFDRLEALIAAQAEQIAQLFARIDVLDGAAVGEL
jgi:hypothetical protein